MRSLARRPYRVVAEIVDAMRDGHLPLDVAGLAPFVDEEADDCCAVLRREAHHAMEARALGLPVLEVRRVQHGPAADVDEAGLHHRWLGGVEHHRHARLRREAGGEVIHVDGAVAAHVVDAHIEHVCSLPDLVAGHANAGLPVGSEHHVAERLRPVRVGALADDEERRVLGDGLRAVQRRQ